jgi:hypothetical protein
MTISYSNTGARISTETMFRTEYFYDPYAGMKHTVYQWNACNLRSGIGNNRNPFTPKQWKISFSLISTGEYANVICLPKSKKKG